MAFFRSLWIAFGNPWPDVEEVVAHWLHDASLNIWREIAEIRWEQSNKYDFQELHKFLSKNVALGLGGGHVLCGNYYSLGPGGDLF